MGRGGAGARAKGKGGGGGGGGAPAEAAPEAPAQDFGDLVTGDANAVLEHDLGAAAWKKAIADADREASHSLSVYSGSSFQQLNRTLREGDWNDWTKKHATNIDRAMTFRLARETFVYRGLSLDIGQSPESLVGTTFRDAAFMSTSLSSRLARGFSTITPSGATPMVVRIRLPGGTRTAPITEMREAELLLPRGGGYKVRKVSRIPGSKIVEVEADYVKP